VIEAVRLVTHLHSEPQSQGYRSVSEHAPHWCPVPQALPGLAAALIELDSQL
jgi:hypothetical protein